MIEVPIRSEIWICYQGDVLIIHDLDLSPDNFSLREVGRAPLSAGVCIGSGAWVGRGDLAYLYLYHVHKRILIQTYDLSKAAFQVQIRESSFGVSSLTTIGTLYKILLVCEILTLFKSDI